MRGHSLVRLALASNRVIVTNAGSMIGAAAVAASIGYVYWWVAVRQFPPAAVGLAAAAVSAMTLLATIGVLGLGTLLIRELPHRPGEEGALIATSLAVAGTVAGGLGVAFALVAPMIVADLAPLASKSGARRAFRGRSRRRRGCAGARPCPNGFASWWAAARTQCAVLSRKARCAAAGW